MVIKNIYFYYTYILLCAVNVTFSSYCCNMTRGGQEVDLNLPLKPIYIIFMWILQKNGVHLNVLVRSNFATPTPFGSVSCFVIQL